MAKKMNAGERNFALVKACKLLLDKFEEKTKKENEEYNAALAKMPDIELKCADILKLIKNSKIKLRTKPDLNCYDARNNINTYFNIKEYIQELNEKRLKKLGNKFFFDRYNDLRRKHFTLTYEGMKPRLGSCVLLCPTQKAWDLAQEYQKKLDAFEMEIMLGDNETALKLLKDLESL